MGRYWSSHKVTINYGFYGFYLDLKIFVLICYINKSLQGFLFSIGHLKVILDL